MLALAQRAEPLACADLDRLGSWRNLRAVPLVGVRGHCSLVGGSIVRLASRERSFSSCCRHSAECSVSRSTSPALGWWPATSDTSNACVIGVWHRVRPWQRRAAVAAVTSAGRSAQPDPQPRHFLNAIRTLASRERSLSAGAPANSNRSSASAPQTRATVSSRLRSGRTASAT